MGRMSESYQAADLNRFRGMRFEMNEMSISFELLNRTDYYPGHHLLEIRGYPTYYGEPGQVCCYTVKLDHYLGWHNLRDQMDEVVRRGILEIVEMCSRDPHYLARQKSEYLEEKLTATETLARQRNRL